MAEQRVLDPALLELVEQLETETGTEMAQETVQVLMALESPVDQTAIQALRDLGVTIETIAGDILTGHMPAGKIQAAAQISGIQKMELGSPQFLEDAPPIDITE